MSMIIGSVALIGCGTQTNEEKVKEQKLFEMIDDYIEQA